jgi:hypothetical protein
VRPSSSFFTFLGACIFYGLLAVVLLNGCLAIGRLIEP